MNAKLAGRWALMMKRCYDPENENYPAYGGRGIRVCERWHDYRNFVEDLGDIPQGMSMDRVDNDGDYSPENVVIADARTQANNTRRNRKYEYQGRTLTIAEWAREKGIDPNTLRARMVSGWPIQRALEEPVWIMTGEQARMSSESGVPASTIHYRLQRGVAPDYQGKYESSLANKYEFRGESRSLKEWSKVLGLSVSTLYERLRRGIPVDLAFTEPLGLSRVRAISRHKLLTCWDDTRTIQEWADSRGIDWRVIRWRLKRGWTNERAIEQPPRDKPGEIKRLADQSGINRSTITSRLRRGRSAEDTVFDGSLRSRDAARYEFRGEVRTLSEWCELLGLNIQTVWNRLQRGLPPEEAFSSRDFRKERKGRGSR